MKGETAEPIGSAFLCPLSAAPGLDDNIYYIVRTRTIGARPIEARPRPDPTRPGCSLGAAATVGHKKSSRIKLTMVIDGSILSRSITLNNWSI